MTRQSLLHTVIGNGFGGIPSLFSAGLLQTDGLDVVDNEFVAQLGQAGLIGLVALRGADDPPAFRPGLALARGDPRRAGELHDLRLDELAEQRHHRLVRPRLRLRAGRRQGVCCHLGAGLRPPRRAAPGPGAMAATCGTGGAPSRRRPSGGAEQPRRSSPWVPARRPGRLPGTLPSPRGPVRAGRGWSRTGVASARTGPRLGRSMVSTWKTHQVQAAPPDGYLQRDGEPARR